MDIKRRYADLLQRKGTIPESQLLGEIVELHWKYTLEEFPEWGTWTGASGCNHRWTDRSPDAYERRRASRETIAAAARAVDREALGEGDRLTLDLFRKQAEDDLEEARFRPELLELSAASGPHTGFPMWLSMMPLARPEHADDFLARLEAIPAELEHAIALFEEGIASGITSPRVVLEGIGDALDAHLGERSPLLAPFDAATADMSKARASAEQIVRAKVAPAFAAFKAFVIDRYVPATRTSIGMSDLLDGDEWYAFAARRYTTTSLSPKEIHDIGLSEVARINDEMRAVIEQTGFNGTRHEFFEHMRTDDRFFFETADELLAAYRDIAKRADPELAKQFGTLPRTPYGVEPVPAHEEKRTTTAYYRPGLHAAGRPGTFFANTYDLRSRPKWEMEALTLHEAVPGHHLQVALAQEMPAMPEFRKHGLVTAYVEGWGLYAESLGLAMGFYTDPYSRFGQLTYEMWRAIRLVVDTGMHALGWTREQAIEMFRENAGKADHDIKVEVDRYIANPGQALAYKIGELKFQELRARAEATLGEQFEVRAFHDEVLRHGAVPLDVLERLFDEWLEAQSVE